jgi:soluble lytic murein transglycosylase-like protein
MIDALRWMLPAVAAMSFSGHPDAPLLMRAAAAYSVPQDVMFAVANEETRHNWRFKGWSRAGAYGRMQIMPQVWRNDPHCHHLWGRAGNAYCGAYILRLYYTQCGTWACAEFRYVGGDTLYVHHVEATRLLYTLHPDGHHPA